VRGVFEGVYGTQRFAFRARIPRQKICRSSCWLGPNAGCNPWISGRRPPAPCLK
jgi:hypothetical protein